MLVLIERLLMHWQLGGGPLRVWRVRLRPALLRMLAGAVDDQLATETEGAARVVQHVYGAARELAVLTGHRFG